MATWIRTDTLEPTSDEYWLTHGTPKEGHVTFVGEDRAQYTDYVFTQPADWMLEHRLFFRMTQTDQVVEGEWRITFPMEDYGELEF